METVPSVLLVLVVFGLFAGLESIRRRLQAIEYKQLTILRHLGLAPAMQCQPSARVKELASDPQKKIEAIRLLRKEANLGLKEAKEVVEELAASKGMTHV
jgi:ribosomal protein L7/L12